MAAHDSEARCEYCMRHIPTCPNDATCAAGMGRRLEALEDELLYPGFVAEWRNYLRRRIHILLHETH